MKKKVDLSSIIPIVAFALIFGLFAIITHGRVYSANNLRNILGQSVPVIIGGLGMLFVIAQGSIDISVGSIVGLAGALGALGATQYGFAWLFPIAIVVGAAVGFLNGFVVARYKVSSFMVTLSMLIAVRGVVNLLLNTSVVFATPAMLALSRMEVKIPILLGLVLVVGYLFEFTKFGHRSKAIGENETAARYVGIPVLRTKVLAFVLSGAMAGVAGVLILSQNGGASVQMGTFYEFRVMMAIFFGGVLVNGGMSTKIFKLLIGVPTIVLMENGLAILGVGGELSEAIEGLLLLLVVFATLYANRRVTSGWFPKAAGTSTPAAAAPPAPPAPQGSPPA